jgi:hypothetical protein
LSKFPVLSRGRGQADEFARSHFGNCTVAGLRIRKHLQYSLQEGHGALRHGNIVVAEIRPPFTWRRGRSPRQSARTYCRLIRAGGGSSPATSPLRSSSGSRTSPASRCSWEAVGRGLNGPERSHDPAPQESMPARALLVVDQTIAVDLALPDAFNIVSSPLQCKFRKFIRLEETGTNNHI